MIQLEVFDQLHYDLQVLVEPVKDLVIKNKDTCELGLTLLRQADLLEDMIDVKRKESVTPYNDAVKRCNEYAKKIAEPLIAAKKLLKSKLLDYERALEREREHQRQVERAAAEKREAEAQEKIRIAKEDAEADALFAAPDEAEQLLARAAAEAERIAFEAKKAHWDASKEIKQNKVPGTTLRWIHEIENESLVPREYLSVDEKKVREFYMAEIKKGHHPQIPGVKIFQAKSISVR